MMATGDETKDDDDSEIGDTRVDPPSAGLLYAMNSYAREFIFLFAVLFTALAAIQEGPLISRKAQTPVPFFSKPSLVTDFYKGELSGLAVLTSEKDMTLVMYYAQWDAESIQARDEFESVARFYHTEVFFVAVNCWWPEGDCSRKYKVDSYPLLLLYVHDVGAIRYDGPILASYVIAFLDHALAPVVTLQHTGELLDLQTKHEGVLVTYFNFGCGVHPPSYKHYYASALRALTEDPYRRLCFAVITNEKVALKFKLDSSVQLYLWNRTVIYTEKSVPASELAKWAYEKLAQVTRWVTPPAYEGQIFASLIKTAAAIIMFTPRNLLLESSPYYDLFREVALDYYNCNSSTQVTPLVHRIVLKRHILQETLSRLIETCQLHTTGERNVCEQYPNICDLTCCQTLPLNLGPYGALHCFCRVCLHHTVHSASKMKLSECENTLELIMKSFEASLIRGNDKCHQIETSYPTKFGSYNRLSFKCDRELEKINFKTASQGDIILDDHSQVRDDNIVAMIKSLKRNLCARLKLAFNYSDVNFPEFPVFRNVKVQANFTGQGCVTNRTLLFAAMDSLLYHPVAEQIGIDLLNKHHQTAVVIVEAEKESLYVLDDHINKKLLEEFVQNYTNGLLDRYLHSTVNKLQSCSESEEGAICVRELTTATFLDFVLENDTDVVIMYYAPWCGACASVFHVFLSISHYFSDIENIKFARISGDDHDLPWEYTVEKYPTIAFFPAYRKPDSMSFPAHLQISTINLLHFILSNCQPKVKWTVTMRMCSRQCVAHNLVRSYSEIRHLVRDRRALINQLHHAWQMASEKSKSIKTKFQKFTRSQLAVRKAESVELWRNYAKYLAYRIHIKQSKIRQAFELTELLKKKRDYYLKAEVSSFDSMPPSLQAVSRHQSSWEKLQLNKQKAKDEL